jgi:FKBP-type peptidyl-prolyl cis-trans isomerase SlyD
MKIENNKVVSLAYKLDVEDENGVKQPIENVEKENPIVFLFGASGFPEKFESELVGLAAGDQFDFNLTTDEAFGDFDENAVVKLPREVFQIDGKFEEDKFKVGMFVPMSDSEGNRMQGKIVSIAEDGIEMDFNHPLAGHNLYFKGEVINVRDASMEEIEHGHVHGEGGHHHH